MRTPNAHEARATVSSVMDRAFAGEPRRVTRHGGAAVLIVSEEDRRRTVGSRGLGHYLVEMRTGVLRPRLDPFAVISEA